MNLNNYNVFINNTEKHIFEHMFCGDMMPESNGFNNGGCFSSIDDGDGGEICINSVCDNTTDKIFLLSVSEVINSDYGFGDYNTSTNSTLEANKTRQRFSTDYAKANNVAENTNGTIWWLRSPRSSNENASLVLYSGANSNGQVNEMSYGIIPALTISLQ